MGLRVDRTRCCGNCGKAIVGVPYVPGKSVGSRVDGLIWRHVDGDRVFCTEVSAPLWVTPAGLMVVVAGTEEPWDESRG